MAGRKKNLYNVRLDGHLIASGITDTEVMDLVGCTKSVLMVYVSKQAPYHTAEGDYTFESISISDKSVEVDPELKAEWDKARKLALKALRSPAAIRRYRAGR